MISALAGILLTMQNASVSYSAGTGLELNVVAIVLFGGVSIFGGRGTIVGVVLSVAIVGSLQMALTQLNVSPDKQNIVTGVLLLISVVVPNGARHCVACAITSVDEPRYRDDDDTWLFTTSPPIHRTTRDEKGTIMTALRTARRIAFAAVAGTLAGGSLAACGSTSDTSTSSAPAAPASGSGGAATSGSGGSAARRRSRRV